MPHRRLGVPRVVARAFGALLVVVGSAGAAAEAPEQRSPIAVADKAAGAFSTQDAEGLATLARAHVPDPWLVAETLLHRKEAEAARAFAEATPPAVRSALVPYVEGGYDHGTSLAPLVAAQAAYRALDPDGMETLLADVPEGQGSPVVRLYRLLLVADLHERRSRHAEAARVAAAVAEEALDLGWFRQSLVARMTVASQAYFLARYDTADTHYRGALELAEHLGDERLMATLHLNLGAIAVTRRRLGEAERYLQEAREAYERTGQPEQVASVLSNLSMVYARAGRLARAVETAREALRRFEEQGKPLPIGIASLQLGMHLIGIGELGEAIEYLDRAIVAYTQARSMTGAARAHGERATALSLLGDTAGALDAVETAVALLRKENSPDAMGNALITRGFLLVNLGRFGPGLESMAEAVTIFERTESPSGLANAMRGLAAAQRGSGDLDGALETLERALALLEGRADPRNRCEILSAMGALHNATGQPARARESYEAALELAEVIDDPRLVRSVRKGLGWAALEAGDLLNAATIFDAVLEEARENAPVPSLLEALRDRAYLALTGSDYPRTLALAREASALIPQVTGRLSQDEATSARDRWSDVYAHGLAAAYELDDPAAFLHFVEIGRAGALLSLMGGREAARNAVVAEPLRRAEGLARQRMIEARAAHQRALRNGRMQAIRDAKAAWKDAAEAHRTLVGRIQRKVTTGTTVLYADPVSLDEAQALLGEGEAYLAFGVWDQAVAMVVTGSGTRMVDLGDAEEVAATVSALDARDPGNRLDAPIAAARKRLLAPLGLPDDLSRLHVSPHGVVSDVPFAVLLPDVEIAYVPSLTTLRTLRSIPPAPDHAVLGLGDPAYGQRHLPPRPNQTRSARLARLPASRPEVEAIADQTLLGPEATETGWKQAVRSRPRWRAVHLACHGVIDADAPETSALMLLPDEANDGLLMLRDLQVLPLGADLVSLSACDTALGRSTTGEGVYGFPWAFMVAGVPRVLVSQWKVDDQATAALMRRFYELWNPEESERGMDAATALRQAQAHVRAQPGWDHPFYWAAWSLWGRAD